MIANSRVNSGWLGHFFKVISMTKSVPIVWFCKLSDTHNILLYSYIISNWLSKCKIATNVISMQEQNECNLNWIRRSCKISRLNSQHMLYLLTVNGAALRHQSSAARMNTALWVESRRNILCQMIGTLLYRDFIFCSISVHYKTVGGQIIFWTVQHCKIDIWSRVQ